jgi:hypothetical protein
MTLAEAERKRDELMKALANLQDKWDSVLNDLQEQCHQFMSTNETKEF